MSKTKQESNLTVEQRLERLERLVVKALVSIPMVGPGQYRLIDIERLSITEQTAMRARFYDNPTALVESDYAVKSVLDICAGSIAAVQQRIDDEKAENDARELAENKRVAKISLDAANKQAAEAQAELDGLSPQKPESVKEVVPAQKPDK